MSTFGIYLFLFLGFLLFFVWDIPKVMKESFFRRPLLSILIFEAVVGVFIIELISARLNDTTADPFIIISASIYFTLIALSLLVIWVDHKNAKDSQQTDPSKPVVSGSDKPSM